MRFLSNRLPVCRGRVLRLISPPQAKVSYKFVRMKLFQGTLKTKFMLSLALISALLTWTTLLLVQYRVRLHVRDEITQGLRNSVTTFQSLQQQRESTLERSAALLATL